MALKGGRARAGGRNGSGSGGLDDEVWTGWGGVLLEADPAMGCAHAKAIFQSATPLCCRLSGGGSCGRPLVGLRFRTRALDGKCRKRPGFAASLLPSGCRKLGLP